MVERVFWEHEVVGSNPATPTLDSYSAKLLIYPSKIINSKWYVDCKSYLSYR